MVLGSVCKSASSLSASVCVRVGRFQPALARHGTARPQQPLNSWHSNTHTDTHTLTLCAAVMAGVSLEVTFADLHKGSEHHA